jgi:uncharacterized protein YjbJ (UPF0337 family)
MNSDLLKGKWRQLQGALRKRWGKLTDDDVSIIAGQRDQLIGRIQERYGVAREEAQKQVNDWQPAADDAEYGRTELTQRRKAS